MRRSIVLLASLVALVAACGGSGTGLSDQEWQYCTVAPDAELDAAAQALNIDPDADRVGELARDRNDPTFQRVCEYAFNAQGADVAPPEGADQPDAGSPTAPLGPGADDASPPPVPSAS